MSRIRSIESCLVLGLAASSAPAQCDLVPPYAAPDHELAGAGFGSAVAMNADGTIALVGGSGFDLGDGIVRAFAKVAGVWTEGTAFRGGAFAGEFFGHAVAMNDAGDLAAVGAPLHFNTAPFVPQAGVVDIWERNAGSGEWTRTHRFWDPAPGFRRSFGVSVDLSADGNTIVIGRAAFLGTETDPLPDAAFVATRTAGSWSALTQLVPTPAPGTLEQFGAKVAINEAGNVVAVGAPGDTFTSGTSGEIHIFRLDAGAWTHTETLTRSTPGEVFNLFGSTFDLSGGQLFAADPARGLYGGSPEQAPDLLVYTDSNGFFGPDPDQIARVPASLTAFGAGPSGLGTGLAVRGDAGLVGAPESESVFIYAFDGGAAFRIERVDGVWSFVSRLEADDPADQARYGAGVAISADGAEYLVGEPGYAPNFDLYGMGRAHFTGQVFREAPFSIAPTESILTLQIDFPGVPTQIIELVVGGSLVFSLPEGCDPADPVAQVSLVGGTLTTDDEPVSLTLAPGVSITASGIELSVAEPSAPALLDAGGIAPVEGAVFQLAAEVQFPGLPAFSAVGQLAYGPIAFAFSGDPGEGLRVDLTGVNISQVIDAGLGDDNPSINANLVLVGIETDPPCNAADFAAPFGLLDLADVVSFVTAFNAGEPAADLAPPAGVFDLADVVVFVQAFIAGCP